MKRAALEGAIHLAGVPVIDPVEVSNSLCDITKGLQVVEHELFEVGEGQTLEVTDQGGTQQ